MDESEAKLTSSGQSPDIDGCAREPIHIPGLIQNHGVLFVLHDKLVIRQSSANTAGLLGRSVESLLGTSLLDLIPAKDLEFVGRLIRDAASTFVNPFRVPIVVRGETVIFDG